MAVPNQLAARFNYLSRQITAVRACVEGLRFHPSTVKRVINRAEALYGKLIKSPISILEVLQRLEVRSLSLNGFVLAESLMASKVTLSSLDRLARDLASTTAIHFYVHRGAVSFHVVAAPQPV
jgi:hypothetical protein